MPAIVDRQAERKKIVLAFQDCLRSKPFDKITVRDIAAQAGIPHPTLLTYFSSRSQVVLAYLDYIADQSVRQAQEWVQAHHRSDFSSDKDYVRGLLLCAVKLDSSSRLVYTGALNMYILGQYEPELSLQIRREFEQWIAVLLQMLAEELRITAPAPVLAHFVLACLEGICLGTYNGFFDGEICENLLDFLSGVIIDAIK